MEGGRNSFSDSSPVIAAPPISAADIHKLRGHFFSPTAQLSHTARATEPADTSLPSSCAGIQEYAAEYPTQLNPPSQMAPWDGSIPTSAPYQYQRPKRFLLAA